MSEKTRRLSWIVGAVIVAGLLLRLWFIRNLALIAGDSLMYGDIARNWMHHGIYGFTEAGRVRGSIQIRPTLIRLPGYPFFLALCFRLFGTENYTAVLYFQAVIDLTACWLAGATATRLFGRRAGIVTLCIAALCPFTASYVCSALTETLVLASIAAALYSFVRWQQAGCGFNIWLWLTASAVAYSILLRPEQVLFAAAILSGMLWRSLRTRNASEPKLYAAKPVFAATLLILLPFVAWTIRNARTFHVFQPLAPRYANDPGELAPLGFARWYRTWAIDYADTENVYWNYTGDPIAFTDLPTRAYTAGSAQDTASESARTAQLLADYNRTTSTAAVSPAIDARFDALGTERIHQHPILYYFALPVARVLNMTFRPRVEMMSTPLEWWQWRQYRAQSEFAAAYALLNLAYIAVAFAGLRAWQQRRWQSSSGQFRELAAAMAVSLALRAVLLLTIDNSEPRYTLEFFPILFLWVGALFAQPVQVFRRQTAR